MIGVSTGSGDLGVVAELFELFKTPWQPVQPGVQYRVAIHAGGCTRNVDADVHLFFGSTEQGVDRRAHVAVRQIHGPVDIEWAGSTFPVHGPAVTFAVDQPLLSSGGRALGYRWTDGRSMVYRLGYDLFDEAGRLLREGQPSSYALTPTLEWHIALVRDLLLQAGVSVVEVPPQPYGYPFICCLTHDVDFFGLRRHKLDSTMAGFLVRGSLGTLLDLCRGRRSVAEAARNWRTVLSLPLVFLGWMPDPWHPLNDYASVERDGRESTFFLVPFKGRPGVSPDGTVSVRRAVRYEAADVRQAVRDAAARGSEIAVHGIDAWRDADVGRAEREQLTAVAGRAAEGVRMHWLYFDRESPRQLEAAGFAYDSTWGFNEAIGYKAGTSQVFRLAGTNNLMELPLSIMDSALFFRGRMNLSREKAQRLCRQLVSNAIRFGGTLVVNWHDRSLVPDRLWGQSYRQLLEEVRGQQAWMTTAGQAVAWFRWRRSIRFVEETDTGRIVVVPASPSPPLPAGAVRIHRPSTAHGSDVEDRVFDGRSAMTVAF